MYMGRSRKGSVARLKNQVSASRGRKPLRAMRSAEAPVRSSGTLPPRRFALGPDNPPASERGRRSSGPRKPTIGLPGSEPMNRAFRTIWFHRASVKCGPRGKGLRWAIASNTPFTFVRNPSAARSARASGERQQRSGPDTGRSSSRTSAASTSAIERGEPPGLRRRPGTPGAGRSGFAPLDPPTNRGGGQWFRSALPTLRGGEAEGEEQRPLVAGGDLRLLVPQPRRGVRRQRRIGGGEIGGGHGGSLSGMSPDRQGGAARTGPQDA